MARLGKITLCGASGMRYVFSAYSWGTNFKKEYGAVYFVTKRTQKTEGIYHRVVYIGETGDLSAGFDNHRKQSCFDRHSANCICVHGEQDEDTRLDIEQDLIDNCRPPCND
jgi:hypothetical protein